MKYLGIYQCMLDSDDQCATQEEWKDFFKECKRMIEINYRKITRNDLANNNWVVDDTLGHLFALLQEKINTYDREKATFKTWINGYIRVLVLEFSYKVYPTKPKQLSQSDLILDDGLDIFDLIQDTENQSPENILQYNEALKDIRLAMELLPGKWYRVLYLRCLKEYSVKETAEKMKIKKDRVYNLTNKARDRLREILKDMGWDLTNYEREAE